VDDGMKKPAHLAGLIHFAAAGVESDDVKKPRLSGGSFGYYEERAS
jgi:hypothetical protein